MKRRYISETFISSEICQAHKVAALVPRVKLHENPPLHIKILQSCISKLWFHPYFLAELRSIPRPLYQLMDHRNPILIDFGHF